MPKTVEGTRLRARVVGEGVVARRVVIRSRNERKKREIGRSEEFAAFAALTEDGTRIEVVIEPNAILEPTKIIECTWKELDNDPYVAKIQRRTGPHAAVTVLSAEIQGGAEIELLYTDAEYAFTEAADHRNAPERTLSRVVARAVAFGDDPESTLDRIIRGDSPRRPRTAKEQAKAPDRALRSPLAIGLLVVCLGFAITGGLIRFSPLTIDLVTQSLVGIVAIVGWDAIERMPRFIDGKRIVKSSKGSAAQAVVPSIAMIVLSTVLYAIIQDLHPNQPPNNVSLMSCIGLFVSGILTAFAIGLRTEKSAATLRRLLLAPKLGTGRLANEYGSVEGTVRDPSPVHRDGIASAILHVIEETMSGSSDPNILVERVLSKGTFTVDGGELDYEVETESNASWASDARIKTVKEVEGRKRIDRVEVVPIGGSILVAGHATRDALDTNARFTEATFFAARRGANARKSARQILVIRNTAIFVALFAAFLAVGVAVLVEPHLPPFSAHSPD